MPKGEWEPKVTKRLTRVVVPVVGLLAVTTALALVGIAPILLFPPSNQAGPRPPAPSASSEVASVAAPPLHAHGGSGRTDASASPEAPSTEKAAAGSSGTGPTPAEESGTVSPPQQPDVGQPGDVARPGSGPQGGNEDDDDGDDDEQGEDEGSGKGKGKGHGHGNDDGQGKDKAKNGKALGHSKDKANGKAKGHGKWQGQPSVAFPPGATKPGHVHSSSARKHSGRGHRPHPRARG